MGPKTLLCKPTVWQRYFARQTFKMKPWAKFEEKALKEIQMTQKEPDSDFFKAPVCDLKIIRYEFIVPYRLQGLESAYYLLFHKNKALTLIERNVNCSSMILGHCFAKKLCGVKGVERERGKIDDPCPSGHVSFPHRNTFCSPPKKREETQENMGRCKSFCRLEVHSTTVSSSGQNLSFWPALLLVKQSSLTGILLLGLTA